MRVYGGYKGKDAAAMTVKILRFVIQILGTNFSNSSENSHSISM